MTFCFRKFPGVWSSDGYANMLIEFDVPSGKSSQKYEVSWEGLKNLTSSDGQKYLTYESVSKYWIHVNITLEYEDFWWNSSST